MMPSLLLWLSLATPQAVSEASAALDAATEEGRREAAERLAELGPAGVDRLLDQLAAAAPEARPPLIAALGVAPASGRVLDALDTALRADQPVLRAAAAMAAAGMGPRARPLVDPLRVAATDGAADVRIFAAEALSHLVHPDNAPVLVALLADPVEDVRAAAAEALSAHGRYAAFAVDVLRRHLRTDPSGPVRAHAAWALGRIGDARSSVLADLVAAGSDPAVAVRRAAREALGLFGDRSAPAAAALEAGLADIEDEGARAAAAWALGRLGPAARRAVPSLVNAALNDAALVSEEAIRALARIGDPSAVDQICSRYLLRGPMLEALADRPVPLTPLPASVITALNDPVPDTRRAALRVSARVRDPAALPVFLSRLSAVDPETRTLAIRAIGGYGPRAAAAVPTLVTLLDDTAPGVAEAAAEALIAIGPAVLPPTRRAFASRGRARPWAALVLGILGSDDARAALQSTRGAADDALRVAAVAALYALDPTDADARDGLEAALTGPSGVARRQAAVALGRMGQKARPVLPALVTAVGAPELDARLAVVAALAQVDDPLAIHALRRALTDGDEEVRMAAAQALARRPADAKAAVSALAAMLDDPDARAGVVAAEVLGALGPAARAAVPKLISVDDADRERLVAAADAIHAIIGPPRLPDPHGPAVRAGPR